MPAADHFPRNATVPIPVDTAQFDGVNQLTGQAANLSLRFVQLETGFTFDTTDGHFRPAPASPVQSLAAWSDYPYDYSKVVQPTIVNWPRGHYRALIRNSASGREYNYDFSLGLFVPRGFGYSAVYDGSVLNLSVWVEEMGVAQSDYSSLTNCQILNSIGTVLPDGNIGTNSAPSVNGIFNFVQTVNLSPVTNYVFAADANVPGPSGITYTFHLQIGLARP